MIGEGAGAATSVAAGGTNRDDAGDTFARVPVRLLDDVQAGRLPFAAVALFAFLHARRNLRTNVLVRTLSVLADETSYPHGHEQLRRELRALREAGWIDFDVRPGQRRPWEITVRHGAELAPARATAANSDPTSTRPPPDLHPTSVLTEEVTSTQWRSQRSAKPHESSISASLAPPPVRSPTEEEEETEDVSAPGLFGGGSGGNLSAKGTTNFAPDEEASFRRHLQDTDRIDTETERRAYRDFLSPRRRAS